VQPKPNSGETVEFAIRLPGPADSDKPVWLPIDAKFPREAYERLIDASENADKDGVEAALKALRTGILKSAKDISDKYVSPPHTTDFAIMFLPTEGLYAEVLRIPGLIDELQTQRRVVVAGPTNLAALLNSLRMGFRTLAIEQRSSEVWQVLSAVKTEFSKFGDVLDKVNKQLHAASNTIEQSGVRTRAMERKLRDVEQMPEAESVALLGLDDLGVGDDDEPEEYV
jgi:DNA recombination protein RmuC